MSVPSFPLLELLNSEQLQAPLLISPPGFPVSEITDATITYHAPSGSSWLDWLRKYQTYVFIAAAGLFVLAIARKR